MAGTIKRSGTPITLEDEEAYKGYFSDLSNLTNFINRHKHLLKCTSCKTNLVTSIKLGKFFSHPLLSVLICEKCYEFYTSGDFSQDEDGSDQYCRWCGNGGLLYLCSKCPYGFCKKCYKHNLPHQVDDMEEDDWTCAVCEKKSLKKLQALVQVINKLQPSPPSKGSKRQRHESSSESSDVFNSSKNKKTEKEKHNKPEKEEN